jgi:hypothetical protein
MADSPQIPQLAPAEAELVNRLVDEYKILQDKIDKIGAFRFTIKGWSITVIIASIFAGSTTSAVPPWVLGVSLLGFLAAFFYFERQQTNFSYRFGQRVLRIEDVLSRLLRKMARELGSEFVRDSFIGLRSVPGIGHRGLRRTSRPRPRTVLRSCFDADVWFYFAQALLVLAFIFLRGGSSPRQRDSTVSNIVVGSPSLPLSEEKSKTDRTYTTGQAKGETQLGLDGDANEVAKKKKRKSN